jgi:acetolactate synthase-1/2/3 large subunit
MVTALLGADYPVINAGQGVLYAEATDDLVEFAELTNIPVLTTLAGKSGFPEDHPLALGTGASTMTLMSHRALQKADFVLGLGTSFTISNFNASMPAGVTLGQVTNAGEDLNKDHRIDFGAVGDAKLVLRQMIEEAKSQLGEHGRGDVHSVRDNIANDNKDFYEQWNPYLNSDEVPISPYRVFTELMKAINPRDAIVTHDSGYPREQIVPFWPAVTPRNYIGWGKSTQLGYGLGLALGAKLAAPDKQVVNVMGDASFGMAGLDIETAVRSEIPILTVVLNNGVMTHYYDHFPYATEHWGTNQLGGEYAQVAEGLGAYAEKVENPDDIAGAIQRALAANAEGKPALLEMKTKEEETTSKY